MKTYFLEYPYWFSGKAERWSSNWFYFYYYWFHFSEAIHEHNVHGTSIINKHSLYIVPPISTLITAASVWWLFMWTKSSLPNGTTTSWKMHALHFGSPLLERVEPHFTSYVRISIGGSAHNHMNGGPLHKGFTLPWRWWWQQQILSFSSSVITRSTVVLHS